MNENEIKEPVRIREFRHLSDGFWVLIQCSLATFRRKNDPVGLLATVGEHGSSVAALRGYNSALGRRGECVPDVDQVVGDDAQIEARALFFLLIGCVLFEVIKRRNLS